MADSSLEAVALGTMVSEFLDGPVWAVLSRQRDLAIQDQVQLLLRTDPADVGAVAGIQGRIVALQAARQWLDSIVLAGQRAHQELTAPETFD